MSQWLWIKKERGGKKWRLQVFLEMQDRESVLMAATGAALGPVTASLSEEALLSPTAGLF